MSNPLSAVGRQQEHDRWGKTKTMKAPAHPLWRTPAPWLSVLIFAALSSCSRAPMESPAGVGSTRSSGRDGVTEVFVPSGTFLMGSEVGLMDEQPAHSVYLDPFWIDRTEATNAMYRRCVEAGACPSPSASTYYDDPSFSDHPVVFVSWTDARTYCQWVGRRLPTEAEWEKAASWDPVTNHHRIYPWGDTFDCSKGNFDDEVRLDDFAVPGGPQCDGYAGSAPVGSYPLGASPYGALDMAGNVWEWVNDAFLETDPYGGTTQNYYAVSPPSNPPGVDPSTTEYRVLRGGSWNYNIGLGRSAYRLWFGLDDSYDGVGFRCAASP
ncbi:MAG TPA: formylglycine-generating enzyme family protein [Anaerolineales bacterium]|nr:formylglycine-generating enzyme family protein [Anaerolineales bacterium]